MNVFLFYALNIEEINKKKLMIIKNSPPTKKSNQAKDMEAIKYSYKVSFKRENKSISDDSDLIKNYNDSLKSPQSRRLYKIIESEFHTDII